jgi:hypothetical protein
VVVLVWHSVTTMSAQSSLSAGFFSIDKGRGALDLLSDRRSYARAPSKRSRAAGLVPAALSMDAASYWAAAAIGECAAAAGRCAWRKVRVWRTASKRRAEKRGAFRHDDWHRLDGLLRFSPGSSALRRYFSASAPKAYLRCR